MSQRIRNCYLYSMSLKIKEENWFGMDFFLSLFVAIIEAVIYYFLFQTIFAGSSRVKPMEITMYFIIVNLVAESYLPAQFAAWNHMNDINTGQIVNYLVRPYHYTMAKLVDSIGLFIIRMGVNLIIVFGATLILGEPLPVRGYLLGTVSMFLGFWILYSIQAVIGCMTVWFHEINKLRNVFMTLLMILGGRVIPSSYLFSFMKKIVYFTPIPYVYDIPVRIFQQQAGLQELMLQCLWGMIFWGLYRWLFERYVAHGAEYGG